MDSAKNPFVNYSLRHFCGPTNELEGMLSRSDESPLPMKWRRWANADRVVSGRMQKSAIFNADKHHIRTMALCNT